MNGSDQTWRQWLIRLQSAYALPLARNVYLLIALGGLITVGGGAVYLVYLKASVLSFSVPGAEKAKATERSVDLALVGDRFEPPRNVGFEVTAAPFTEPPKDNQSLGYFFADTSNGLAVFPDGVSVIGGRDAELFERVQDAARDQIGLAARPALGAMLAEALGSIKEETSRTFEIRVVTRDRYGLMSAPADISFVLYLAPKPATPSKTTPQPLGALPTSLTELQAVAKEVARITQPEVNPAFFAAYQAALKAPRRCGARDDDPAFVANYRKAVEQVRSRLTAANVEALYVGLCDAWSALLAREAQERERANAERRQAEQLAEQARDSAKMQAMVTVSVIGGALGIFLLVALGLALLAIEGHSRAIRALLESVVGKSEGREADEYASTHV